MAKKKKARPKPSWERGYNGHVLWSGKQKLGKVTLVARSKYSWQAAGRAGMADVLGKAKKAVEYAVLTADRQLDLFQ